MSNFQGRDDHGSQGEADRSEWGRSADRGQHDRDDQLAPGTRDEKGRFVGCGNSRGRPRKPRLPKAPPANTLVGKMLEGLASEVPTRPGAVKITYVDALIRKILADLLTGTAADRARLLKYLFQLLDLQAELDAHKQHYLNALAQPHWSQEMERQYQALAVTDREFERMEADRQAFIDSRAEDYAGFVAARHAVDETRLDEFN